MVFFVEAFKHLNISGSYVNPTMLRKTATFLLWYKFWKSCNSCYRLSFSSRTFCKAGSLKLRSPDINFDIIVMIMRLIVRIDTTSVSLELRVKATDTTQHNSWNSHNLTQLMMQVNTACLSEWAYPRPFYILFVLPVFELLQILCYIFLCKPWSPATASRL